MTRLKPRIQMKAVSAMLGLGLALCVARLATAQDYRPPAPDLDCDVWLNSPPLKLAKLRGKVVLVDFWEYTCINCVRTFPYLRRWHRLYGPLGLVVIGVHSPEFYFARDPALVADAARRFGFTFPIAVDSDHQVWRAFQANAWPTKYLIDKDGGLALQHVGEGEYGEFERRIQTLLKDAQPTLDFSAARFAIPKDEALFGGACRVPTRETYLGFGRGERIANPGGYQPLRDAVYHGSSKVPLDGYALEGRWLAALEFVRHSSSTKDLADYLELNYRAKSVYLVAGSDDGASKALYVTQDGKPLPKSARGVDVKADTGGRTYIALGSKRMYYVVDNPAFEEHSLRLYASTPAVSLYSFTFGNNCENAFDHR